MSREVNVTGSSGNVFRDLDVSKPDEVMVKAQLAARIASIIKHRHLSQGDAAEILGTTQPKVSALVRGELYGFSTTKLFQFLNALGRDVEISVRKRGRASDMGRLLVTG